MIKLEHVSKSYSAGVPALNDASINIEEGEFVFVVGNSGSGKSTLLDNVLHNHLAKYFHQFIKLETFLTGSYENTELLKIKSIGANK